MPFGQVVKSASIVTGPVRGERSRSPRAPQAGAAGPDRGAEAPVSRRTGVRRRWQRARSGPRARRNLSGVWQSTRWPIARPLRQCAAARLELPRQEPRAPLDPDAVVAGVRPPPAGVRTATALSPRKPRARRSSSMSWHRHSPPRARRCPRSRAWRVAWDLRLRRWGAGARSTGASRLRAASSFSHRNTMMLPCGARGRSTPDASPGRMLDSGRRTLAPWGRRPERRQAKRGGLVRPGILG